MTIVSNAKKAAVSADEYKSTLTLTFANGAVLEVNADNLSADMKHKAMMHGLKQKLVDGAAIARSQYGGHSPSIDDKFTAVKEIADRLLAGEWNKVRGGAGTSASANTLLARALVEMTGKTPEVIAAFLESKTKEQKDALRKTEKVAVLIARMQAQAATSIDTDDLLAELDDDVREPGSDDDIETADEEETTDAE